MKKLLLLPLLLLASCAPILGTAQGTASTLSATASSITFTNADSLPALKVVVAVDGASISDVRCGLPRQGVTVCKLGDVALNSAASLAYTGSLTDANATWRTPEGKLRAIVLSR